MKILLPILRNVALIYLLLTAATTAVMHEFSFRYTLFLLLDAILITAGSHLLKEKKWYYRAIVCIVTVLGSACAIRFLTETTLKVRDLDAYLSFCLAVANILIITVSLLPSTLPAAGKLKKFLFGAGSLLLFLPILILWGYYFSESSWLNVDGVMALLQTNASEAVEYLQDKLSYAALIFISLYLLLACAAGSIGSKLELKGRSWKLYAGAAVFLILNIVLMVRTGQVNNNFVTTIFLETKNYASRYDEYIKLAEQRKQRLHNTLRAESTGEPGVYVLVIGESQNRTRMSAYGYHLKTTPWLDEMKQDKNLLLFQHAYSCHTQTVPTLSYALTAKNQYNAMDLKDAVSLIDVANAAGYETVWLSNQTRYGVWDTPVTVIAGAAGQQIWLNTHITKSPSPDTDYHDAELVRRLQDIRRSDKMLIVIHLMGSHIAYHKRYPAEFSQFKAEGRRSEYDNSILYNDYVMKELVKKISAWPNFKGLVYFSDHSEGVSRDLDHNPDTFIFEMSYIPMYMYFSEAYQQQHPQKIATLRAAQKDYFTNDLIFNAMLGIMNIQHNSLYEPENDLTSPQYNKDLNRFSTMFGKRKIKEDAEIKVNGSEKAK
ncbi:MAG: phosphoethanolamine transferase [Acidaminococcaceae bacterium]|nr:phosphoethanolamine transferase [Acidaminococcaceae bacterium]MBP3264999.1 phosphoethanolamine transferase [Acidaminococcaceae bacterium]